MKGTPLFHISKRAALPWYQSWGIRLAAIILALAVCALVTTLLTGVSPIGVYVTIIQGSFGTVRKFWVLLQELAILLCVSLAVTPAFKMRFWNIGGEGQVLIGGLATAACMFYLGNRLPGWLLIPVMILASLAAAGIWALIPAIFKAKWNTNETLFTLMMNYVAIQLVSYFCNVWDRKGSGIVGIINPNTQAGWFPVLAGREYLLNVIVVAVLTVALYAYLRYTKHGYELSVVGESERTARYVGIKVERVILRTMLLSGALCGVCGLLLVGGTDHTISTTTAGGRGFTAVMVSWLAKFNPIFMVLTSFLLAFLSRGSSQIAQNFGLNHSFGDILTGIILFFIIGSEFFINYRISFRTGGEKEGGSNA
ncbi:MAG: ABC transporter permease [Oscillospiraceae bacterium]|nr:ABC transporter permease [Oscillospiraceae bacterium]